MEIIELDNAFCGQGKIVKFYVEYLNRSLKDELKKRRKHKTYFFSEEQCIFEIIQYGKYF
jgi:hypothetical protein